MIRKHFGRIITIIIALNFLYAGLLTFGVPVFNTKTRHHVTKVVDQYYDAQKIDDPNLVYQQLVTPSSGGIVSLQEIRDVMQMHKWAEEEEITIRTIRYHPQIPRGYITVHADIVHSIDTLGEANITLWKIDNSWKIYDVTY